MAGRRRFLGREFAAGSQFRVYLLHDALEVDELTYSEGERTRVYFDDVLLMTYHRKFGAPFLVVMGIFAALFLGIGLVVGMDGSSRSDREAMVILFVLSAPFLLGMILRIIFRIDVITVFGRRTFARMNFHWRKGRAREIFEELKRKIGERQAEVAREQAALAPPPPPEPPGPPAFPSDPLPPPAV